VWILCINDLDEYTAYTTKVNSGPAVPSTNQPSADSGGVTTNLAPGQYQYVFQAKAPGGFDQTATHTIGIYASRDLTKFNLGTNYASTTAPTPAWAEVFGGSGPTNVRDSP